MLNPSSYMKMEARFFCEAPVRSYQITWPHVAQIHKRATDHREHFDAHKMDKFFRLLQSCINLDYANSAKTCRGNTNLSLLIRTSTNIIVCAIKSYANLYGGVLRLLSTSGAKVERRLFGAVPQRLFVLMAW